MIEYLNTKIKSVSVHQIGNKSEEEGMSLSKKPLNISDEKLQDSLLMYFLAHFRVPEFFSFTFSNDDLRLNPVCQFAKEIFTNPDNFHKESINIAKHLYECSNHPNIKAGDFFVAYFSNIEVENEASDAIGLFKSENKDLFLKLIAENNKYELICDDGMNIDKLDKGCLIFNQHKKDGYKVCIIDKSNKGGDAQYWKDSFLTIKAFNDNFHHTHNYLNLAKSFVTNKITDEFELNKADQIDLLNKSIEYFKKTEQFDEKEFTESIFEDKEVIKSFKKYKKDYQDEKEIEFEEQFLISTPAVKKQSRIFKSILKLDKNFHIYIHGNKELIEKGTEKDGRKFYKIYYNEEL